MRPATVDLAGLPGRPAARPRGRAERPALDERPGLPRAARVRPRRRPAPRALALVGAGRPAARAAVPRLPPHLGRPARRHPPRRLRRARRLRARPVGRGVGHDARGPRRLRPHPGLRRPDRRRRRPVVRARRLLPRRARRRAATSRTSLTRGLLAAYDASMLFLVTGSRGHGVDELQRVVGLVPGDLWAGVFRAGTGEESGLAEYAGRPIADPRARSPRQLATGSAMVWQVAPIDPRTGATPARRCVLLTRRGDRGLVVDFDGVAWLLVGAAGAALGAGVVLLHRRTARWSGRRHRAAGLPGARRRGCWAWSSAATVPRGETLTRVISGAWECWPLLVGTHPPVEATGAGAARARARRRADAPRSPRRWRSTRRVPAGRWCRCSCCSPACSVTGSHGPTSVGLVGAAYGSGLPGLGRRPRRAAVDAGPRGGRSRRRSWWSARCSPSRWAAACSGTSATGWCCARRRRRTASAWSPRRSTRSGGYRKQPDLPDNAWRVQLLRVSEAPAGTVLRFTVLNRYDGQRWVAANDVEPGSHDDRFQLFSADYLTTDEAVGTTPVRVELTGAWNSQWVPLAGRLVGLNVDFPGVGPARGAALQPGHLDRGGDPDARRQRRVRVLLRAARHHAAPGRRRRAVAARSTR